jgi:hypothetical protein
MIVLFGVSRLDKLRERMEVVRDCKDVEWRLIYFQVFWGFFEIGSCLSLLSVGILGMYHTPLLGFIF